MLFSIRNHQVRGTPMAMEIPINTVCIHGEYGSVAIISKDRAMSRTSTYIHLGVSIAMEVPANGKIPLKWMIWGYPYFRKPPFVVFGVPKLYYIDSTQIFTHILCFIYIITNIFFFHCNPLHLQFMVKKYIADLRYPSPHVFAS